MLQYPQYIYSNEILKQIDKNKVGIYKVGVDIPCGTGYTTNYLSKKNKLSWLGVDIEEKSIDFAKNNFSRERLIFQEGNIFSKLQELKNVDVLCIINFIFLLPEHDKLFNLVFSCLSTDGELYFIIPNIDGINYRNFIKNNPNVNTKEYRIKELKEELEKHNLVTQIVKEICYANVYGRKEIRFMSRFAPYYLIILNYIMTWLKAGTPSYFLVKVKKQKA